MLTVVLLNVPLTVTSRSGRPQTLTRLDGDHYQVQDVRAAWASQPPLLRLAVVTPAGRRTMADVVAEPSGPWRLRRLF